MTNKTPQQWWAMGLYHCGSALLFAGLLSVGTLSFILMVATLLCWLTALGIVIKWPDKGGTL